jgi:hypothetical protein
MITIEQAKLLFPDFTEPQKTQLARGYMLRVNAQESAKNIPSWATWTEAEADAWYQTNIRTPFAAASTLAAMKAVIGTIITVQWATIRLVLALRDHNWLDLSG